MVDYRSRRDWPYHLTAGGILFRETDQGREYLLLRRSAGRRGRPHETWHLPKGTLSAGEPVDGAALREVEEETGQTGVIVAFLGSLQGAWVDRERGWPVDKTNLYFLIEWTGPAGVEMDDEHDGVEWQTPAVARARLSVEPKREEMILDRAEAWFARNQ